MKRRRDLHGLHVIVDSSFHVCIVPRINVIILVSCHARLVYRHGQYSNVSSCMVFMYFAMLSILVCRRVQLYSF